MLSVDAANRALQNYVQIMQIGGTAHFEPV
jgi:hypothetical protein